MPNQSLLITGICRLTLALLLVPVVVIGEQAVPAAPAPGPRQSVKAFNPEPVVLVPTPTASPLPQSPAPTPPPPDPTPVPTPEPTPVPTPPPPAYVPPSPPAAPYNELSRTVLGFIGDQRARAGLPPLTPNNALINAAQQYADFVFAAGPYQLSHTLDGTPADRAARQGYAGGIGEILATASPSAQQMIDLWMGSPPHQAILMDGRFQDIGVGCATGLYTDPNGNTFDTALCVGMLGMP